MKREFKINRLKTFIILVVLFLLAYGGDGCPPGPPVIECDGEHQYGPAGGTIEITDPSSQLYGLRVVIPAGALDQCRTFNVTDWYVAWFPTGCIFYPRYDTQFTLGTAGEKPFGLELEFYFPMTGVVIESGESPCAFGYDIRTEKWNVIMPDSYDGTTMMVRTTYHEYWGWGKIDLDAVSSENLIGAMKETYGEEAWNSAIGGIIEAVDVLYTLYVDKTCQTWTRMRDVDLPNLIQTQRNILSSYQSQIGQCGACDLFSEEFGLDLSKYILANIVILATDLWDLFTGDMVGCLPFLSDVDFLMSVERFIAISFIESLECDYPCVTEKLGLGVYTTYALHYVYMITHYIVTLAIGGDFWVYCP